MKNRCSNPQNAAYANYGARGIVVCERWSSSFAEFLADIGRKPSPKHTIERIDNDGNYEPGNCRWATKAEQNRNYSRNRPLTLDGRTQLLTDWASEVGIKAETVSSRIDVHGWSVADALRIPVGEKSRAARGKDRATHCVNGHRYTPETSGRNAAGWRFCRTCSRDRQRDYMRAKRRAR